MIEPSGVYWGYHGTAIGKGRQLARTEIEKLNLSEMTVEEGVEKAAEMWVEYEWDVDGLRGGGKSKAMLLGMVMGAISEC